MPIRLARRLLVPWIVAIIFMLNAHRCQGRTHFHKRKSHASEAASPLPQIPSDPVPSPPDSGDSHNSNSDGCVLDVTTYGAVGDGETDDTAAFRLAWKDACAVESAVLLVPSGYVFTITSTIFSGPCKPGLVFQVDGVLMPPDGPDSWPESDSKHQWLVFYRLDGMTLTGNGVIEGNGEKWWELPFCLSDSQALKSKSFTGLVSP